MNRLQYALVAVLAVVVIAVGVILWKERQAEPTPPPMQPPVAAVPPEPAAPAPSEPAIKHPIESAPVAETPAAAPLDLVGELTGLFGRKVVLSMLQTDDFPRRFVATVDNLARPQAPVSVWPVNPTPGRFTVQSEGGEEVISADNGLRYTPFMLLVETVEMREAVAVYVRQYPQFQQAYEELGYPKQYFNDRLVEVIDHLLATPEPTGPLKVRLTEVRGPVQPERPWVFYEFADPALESLSSGQKILLRMGPVNERRMKAKLAEIRRLVTGGAVGR